MTRNTLLPPAANRAFRRFHPACLGALFGVLLVPSVYAQPMTVTGPLMAGDGPTGNVRDLEVVARRWISATRFQFELPVGSEDDDKAALLYGTIDIRQPDTSVVGRVCSDVALSTVETGSNGFAVTMLARTEAQLVSRSKRGIVIKVPAPVPDTVEEERLLPASALAAQCPEVRHELGQEMVLFRFVCEPFRAQTRPRRRSKSWMDAASARRRVRTVGSSSSSTTTKAFAGADSPV